MKRPGVITFIGVIMLLQATLTLVGGIVVLALSTQDRIMEQTSLSTSELTHPYELCIAPFFPAKS